MSDLTGRLDAIQAQLDAATQGAWSVDRNYPFTQDLVGIFADEERKYVLQVENQDDVDDPTSDADAEFIASSPENTRFLLDLARKEQAAIDAVTARLDEWDAMKAFPDADKTQEWYSLGKRHASESIRLEIAEALEAKP
jgi:hypothetical protein